MFSAVCENTDLIILVPYRNRENHLVQFVPWMEQFLAGRRYCIVVVEQMDQKAFNRGKLLNVGYQMTREYAEWVCFHDVDLLPVHASCDYSRPEYATHLSAYVDIFDYRLPYDELIGGVLLTPKDAFETVNGYSNEYWGWGQEDDDLYVRFCAAGMQVRRRPGRYKSLSHSKSPANRENIVRFASVVAAAAKIVPDPSLQARAAKLQHLLRHGETPLDANDGLSAIDCAGAQVSELRGAHPSLAGASARHRLIKVSF